MINYAILLGRVGKKDVKNLSNGGELTIISLATNKKFTDSSGNIQKHTTWHTISCFSKLAEVAKKYVKVGDMLFVQGEIQYKQITSGERQGQYAYSVHANDIKFIPSGKKLDNKEDSSEVSDFEEEIPF